MSGHRGTPREKALEINLNAQRYGSFAEIGAGQEVVRWFFQAGGAAGTIAKSISAYDMKVSDAIYGRCARYVCRERLEAMLECEQQLNRERLSPQRGDSTTFFTFADTVSARNYHGTNECHGWMGIRFQTYPGGSDNSIIIHVRMVDTENALQQDALGVVGVNLIHGAFRFFDDPHQLLESLLDNLSADRIEIDMIDFSGDAFAQLDNRIMALRLVQTGMTGGAMFAADGTVLQPSEALRKRPLLIERGRFRPVTHVNIDLLECALRKFDSECDLPRGEALPIMEMTMHSLSSDGNVCLEDFISRAEVLEATGHTVLISDFFEYHRLAAWLCRYTDRPVALAMGLNSLEQIFQERHYESLDGGILESFGRLFKSQLRVFVYPARDAATAQIRTTDCANIKPSLRHIYDYLTDRGYIAPLDGIREELLAIHSPEVLRLIASGDDAWTSMVPDSVTRTIKARKLFGYSGSQKNPVQNSAAAAKAVRAL